ncbi:MAG: VOC family protein [bacterium]
MSLPDKTRIAHAHLRVKNSAAVETFYRDLLGLREIGRDGSTVSLSPTGKSPALIILTESPAATPRPHGTTGLFHIAIRYPDRSELSKTLNRIIEQGYPIQGAADHAVSEAIYLADPEGNGIELYRDRPREEWKWRNNEIVMVTDPLDVDDLLKEAEGKTWSGMHPKTDIGHMHLNVGSLQDAEKFYHGTIGFDVTTKSYPGALFVAAGGYHHHLGLNIWAGRNAPPPPENSIGLISFGIAIPRSGWKSLKGRLAAGGVRYESDTPDESLKVYDPNKIEIELIAVD